MGSYTRTNAEERTLWRSLPLHKNRRSIRQWLQLAEGNLWTFRKQVANINILTLWEQYPRQLTPREEAVLTVFLMRASLWPDEIQAEIDREEEADAPPMENEG